MPAARQLALILIAGAIAIAIIDRIVKNRDSRYNHPSRGRYE